MRRVAYNGVMAERWITTREAAQIAGYHPERIRELLREGKVRARKFGLVWQVHRLSLLGYRRRAKRGRPRKA